MIKCDQFNCNWWYEGACIAENIELAEAPGGFWLNCRTKVGRQWRPDVEPTDHVCGKQGFGIGEVGMWDVCPVCEEDKKARGLK